MMTYERLIYYYKIHIKVCKKYRHRSKVRKGTEKLKCRYFFEEQNINTLSEGV